MLKETQQLIIITLGIIAILTILKDYDSTMLGIIIGILGGFLTGKKIFVDPETQNITEIEGEEIA